MVLAPLSTDFPKFSADYWSGGPAQVPSPDCGHSPDALPLRSRRSPRSLPLPFGLHHLHKRGWLPAVGRFTGVLARAPPGYQFLFRSALLVTMLHGTGPAVKRFVSAPGVPFWRAILFAPRGTLPRSNSTPSDSSRALGGPLRLQPVLRSCACRGEWWPHGGRWLSYL